MSQDGKQLSLKNKVQIRQTADDNDTSRRDSEKVIYSNIIEVLSPPPSANEPLKTFSVNNGEKLVLTSRDLFRRSLDLLLKDLHGLFPDSSRQTSVKINVSGGIRFERATHLIRDCATNVISIKNLRGWLISSSDNSVDPRECVTERKQMDDA